MSATRPIRSIALTSVALAVMVAIAGCGGAKSRLASHMKRGQDYFQNGDFAKAGVEFRNAMQIDPKDPMARVKAAEAAAKLGQVRGAYSLLQSVIDDHPDSIQARTDLGGILITAGAAQKGLDVIKPALDRQPNDATLLALRAAAKSSLKDAVGARVDADHALAADPNNEDAIDLRAGLYRQDGDLPAAIKLVNAAATARPNMPGFRQVLISLYEAANQPERAEEQLRALIRLKPDQLSYRTQLALFLSRSMRLDEAQIVLDDGVRALPASDEAKLLQVDFLAQQRSHEMAEQALRKYIAADADDYTLRLALGVLLQKWGESDKAVTVYNEIVKLAGTEPNGLIARDRLAAIAILQKREPDAQRLLAEVLKISPRDNDALALRGQMSLAHGDSTGAIADLRAVLRDQPRNSAVNRALAQALIAQGDMALAEEPLRTAVEAAPSDGPLRVTLAQLLFQLQRRDQALEVLQQAVKALPTDKTVNEGLIRAYLEQKNIAAAAGVADEYRQARPDDASPYVLTSLVALADKRPDDAQKSLETALTLQPHAYDVLADLVRVQTQRGQGAQAVTRLQALIDANPKDALISNLLSETYLQQNNVKAAQQSATQAIARQPTWWAPYRSLGLAKLAAQDIAGAIAAYETGAKLAPNQTVMLSDLGILYQRVGRIDDAVKLYDSWIRLDPKSPVAANNFAMLLVNYRTDKASLDRAQALTAGFGSANNGDLLDTAGWVQFKRGEYTRALPVLQHAVALRPESREAHYHLGMAELRSGQTDRARSDLESALAGTGQFYGADDARAALASLKNRAG
jgi:tetratricopeptide (TPR) repeat protein